MRKIFFNGPIITMNPENPFVESAGVDGEKIISVGKLDNVKKDLGNDYELIDLKNNTLLPGFIDSHMHPISFMFLLLNLDLSKVKSLVGWTRETKRSKGTIIEYTWFSNREICWKF